MANNKNKSENEKSRNIPFNNDQLGENASEQYKSEEYGNTGESKNNK